MFPQRARVAPRAAQERELGKQRAGLLVVALGAHGAHPQALGPDGPLGAKGRLEAHSLLGCALLAADQGNQAGALPP